MKPVLEINPLDELLDNIDKLTKPIKSKVVQDTTPGKPPRVVKIALPPLLTQLEVAIGGTIGIGGSGSLPSERNMLDADALLRFVTIKAHIREWTHRVGAKYTPEDPARSLRAWYAKWVSIHRERGDVRFYLGRTKSWITQIEEKLDPPRIRDLPDWCPNCMATEWWNPIDKKPYLRPLVVEYHLSHGSKMIEEATARCRACGEEWGVRQLAYELEQIEKARQEGRDEVWTAIRTDREIRRKIREMISEIELDIETTTV